MNLSGKNISFFCGVGIEIFKRISSRIKSHVNCYHLRLTFEDHLLLFLLSFFRVLFDCPTANFGALLWRQPQSPDVNQCVLCNRSEGHRDPIFRQRKVYKNKFAWMS